MSCSSESTGLKPAMLTEKPSFAQTCNLLSQYLKEKGGFGDLSLGMTSNAETNGTPQVPPATMNLFPVEDKSGDVCSLTVGAPRNLGSMDLFPQRAGFSAPAPKDNVRKRVDCSAKNKNMFEPQRASFSAPAPKDNVRKRVDCSATNKNMFEPQGAGFSAPAPKDNVQKRVDCSATNKNMFEPQPAQMTIFYGGQVIVFNDFPADKAKEIMLLAGKCSSKTKSFNPSPCTSSRAGIPIESRVGIPPTSKAVRPPIPGDLPIARRASLHRFLEKRKDRITTQAPYHKTSLAASPSKSGNSKSWLGLAAQSP